MTAYAADVHPSFASKAFRFSFEFLLKETYNQRM
ncbi:hypothetical protein SAMN04489868_15111 [Pisciglobus halotolerans]|uniref:Uncharacterized protein n=1 Tax=Pisciglobus halotolerans TaxID=745365 RepID=A0A1I3DSN1_9LACT|nr:hypothetical protein SAMN04489868_15111 [Pisciglobus halotolerans]